MGCRERTRTPASSQRRSAGRRWSLMEAISRTGQPGGCPASRARTSGTTVSGTATRTASNVWSRGTSSSEPYTAADAPRGSTPTTWCPIPCSSSLHQRPIPPAAPSTSSRLPPRARRRTPSRCWRSTDPWMMAPKILSITPGETPHSWAMSLARWRTRASTSRTTMGCPRSALIRPTAAASSRRRRSRSASSRSTSAMSRRSVSSSLSIVAPPGPCAQTHPSGLGRPATLQAPREGPSGNSS